MEVLTFPFSPCNTSDGYNFSFSGQKSPKHLLHKTASKSNCLRFILQFYKIHIFRVSDIGAIASSQACCSFTETTLSCGPDLSHFTQLFTRVTGGSALAKEFLITSLEFIGGSLIPMCKRCRLNFLLPRVCYPRKAGLSKAQSTQFIEAGWWDRAGAGTLVSSGQHLGQERCGRNNLQPLYGGGHHIIIIRGVSPI